MFDKNFDKITIFNHILTFNRIDFSTKNICVDFYISVTRGDIGFGGTPEDFFWLKECTRTKFHSDHKTQRKVYLRKRKEFKKIDKTNGPYTIKFSKINLIQCILTGTTNWTSFFLINENNVCNIFPTLPKFWRRTNLTPASQNLPTLASTATPVLK